VVDKLIKAGADPNRPLTSFDDTALMMAARTGRPDAVQTLLDAGANVNAARLKASRMCEHDAERDGPRYGAWLRPRSDQMVALIGTRTPRL
jgi:ankyrin repeat protein